MLLNQHTDISGVSTERVSAPEFEDLISNFGRNDCQALAFVGNIERIEAENLASASHLFGNGDCAFFQQNANPSLAGNLVESAGDATSGRVAQNARLLREVPQQRLD